nr:hypothetical protein [uncultured Methanoregula sp.]
MSGKIHWTHRDCSSGYSDQMKRIYQREPGTGKFIPIGWWCPHCNKTEFFNQCHRCQGKEPNPDSEEFKKTGLCWRCREEDQKPKISLDRPEGCLGCSDLVTCTTEFDSVACKLRRARIARNKDLLKVSD